MDALNLPETCDALPSLSVLVSQLTAYRTTGSVLHGARTPDETRRPRIAFQGRAIPSKDIAA